MNIKKWIIDSYKFIVVGVGVLGILGVVSTTAITVYSAQQDIKNIKETQVKSFEQINKNMELQFNTMRLQILTDQENSVDMAIQNRTAKHKDTKKLQDIKNKIEKEKSETLNKILDQTKTK